MNKEEIEELKDFTIDITYIDELALGLEVCSKKSNMVIQEFADTIIQLQQENKKYKEVIDKLNIKIEENKKNIDESGSFVETYTGWKLIPEILEELLDILKEVK